MRYTDLSAAFFGLSSFFGLSCFCGLSLILVATSLPTGVSAAELELLMIESRDCPYCQKFDREIAPIYPKTAEGKRAPLVRISLDGNWPEKYRSVKPDIFTPHFILVDSGKEVARLRGYNGDEFFWFLLGELFTEFDNQTAN